MRLSFRAVTYLLAGSLLLCAGLAALLVYRYDLHEREPWWMLLLTAAVGALAMRLAGVTETAMLYAIADDPAIPLVALVAASHEEFLRIAAVAAITWVFPRHVNDPMDGIVYGSTVGLGMAVAESLDYMAYLPPRLSFLPPSEVVRLLGHLVLGGIACYGLGLARLRRRGWPGQLLGWAGFAIVWHFLWDWIAFSALETGAMRPWHTLLGIALMLTGLLVYGALVVAGSTQSRALFAPESVRDVWGWPFTLWQRRDR